MHIELQQALDSAVVLSSSAADNLDRTFDHLRDTWSRRTELDVGDATTWIFPQFLVTHVRPLHNLETLLRPRLHDRHVSSPPGTRTAVAAWSRDWGFADAPLACYLLFGLQLCLAPGRKALATLHNLHRHHSDLVHDDVYEAIVKQCNRRRGRRECERFVNPCANQTKLTYADIFTTAKQLRQLQRPAKPEAEVESESESESRAAVEVGRRGTSTSIVAHPHSSDRYDSERDVSHSPPRENENQNTEPDSHHSAPPEEILRHSPKANCDTLYDGFSFGIERSPPPLENSRYSLTSSPSLPLRLPFGTTPRPGEAASPRLLLADANTQARSASRRRLVLPGPTSSTNMQFAAPHPHSQGRSPEVGPTGRTRDGVDTGTDDGGDETGEEDDGGRYDADRVATPEAFDGLCSQMKELSEHQTRACGAAENGLKNILKRRLEDLNSIDLVLSAKRVQHSLQATSTAAASKLYAGAVAPGTKEGDQCGNADGEGYDDGEEEEEEQEQEEREHEPGRGDVFEYLQSQLTMAVALSTTVEKTKGALDSHGMMARELDRRKQAALDAVLDWKNFWNRARVLIAKDCEEE